MDVFSSIFYKNDKNFDTTKKKIVLSVQFSAGVHTWPKKSIYHVIKILFFKLSDWLRYQNDQFCTLFLMIYSDFVYL